MDAGIADDVSQLSEGMGMTALEGVTDYMKVTEPRLVLSLSILFGGTRYLCSAIVWQALSRAEGLPSAECRPRGLRRQIRCRCHFTMVSKPAYSYPVPALHRSEEASESTTESSLKERWWGCYEAVINGRKKVSVATKWDTIGSQG